MPKKIEFIIAIIFVLIGVSLRLLPHAPNFTPVIAIALFGGAYLSKKIALILPITIMMISDIFIGSYEIKLMISVYLAFLICVFLGFYLKKNKKASTIIGSSVLSAFTFFILTNFAVWVFTPWYAKNLSGLIQCYFMALPFFKNTLLSTLFYNVLFFTAYESVKLLIIKKIKYEVL